MNPKKIGISHPWASRNINQNIGQDIWIRKSINGIFANYNMIPSEIFIHDFPKKISLKFLVFIPKRTSKNKIRLLLPKIISLLKSLLTLKFNKNIHISLKVVPSLFHDAHILGKWLKLEKNPVKLKYALKKLVKRTRFRN